MGEFYQISVRVYQNAQCRFMISNVRTSDATQLLCPILLVFNELLITSEFYKNMVSFTFKQKYLWGGQYNLWDNNVTKSLNTVHTIINFSKQGSL